MTERDIFLGALDVPSADRWAFLERACGHDPELRRKVDGLLAAHDRAGAFLEHPPSAAAAVSPKTAAHQPGEQSGTVVAGRYKLLEVIGEGGMGAVWMAEQREPVKRLVAVKLIKPGMDTKQVLARFEAERQALALMDHPNIAKVHDGGTTEHGRPYFVMELVKGLPLTEYCDQRRLPVRDRLGLFVQVCGAVQHAHQKGVIHRDLKPTNVLVTEHDGTPVPKVIDFGLAKALHATSVLTDKTLHTSFGAVVGTPLYMAPEQVGINALDVDTRTDVYALGVILYELVTGTTPIDRKRLNEAVWDEVRRLIREEEPPRPSTRLSTSDALPSLATTRQTEPAKLSRLVKGELDWIVMRALEKDRSRRYQTANGLARDVERYLADEPVEACPPTAGYRLRKFARKHRPVLLGAAGFALLMTAGVGVSTWQAIRATRAEAAARDAERQAREDRADAENQRRLAERREAEARENERKARAAEAVAKESEATAKAILEFVQTNVFAAPNPVFNMGRAVRDMTVRQALDAAEPTIAAAFADRPRVEVHLRNVLGVTYRSLGELRLALTQHERAYAVAKAQLGPDDPLTMLSEFNLAVVYYGSDRYGRAATSLLEQSLARRRQTLGPDHPDTEQTLDRLARLYRGQERHEDARKLAEELLRIRQRRDMADAVDQPGKLLALYDAYEWAGRQPEALRLLEDALPRLTAKRGPDDDHVLDITSRIAARYQKQGRYAEAVALLEPAQPRAVAKYGYGLAGGITDSMSRTLVNSLDRVGRAASAARLLEAALPELREKLGPANSAIAPYVINLSARYRKLGRDRERVVLLEATVAAIPAADRPLYQNFQFVLSHLANAYLVIGDEIRFRRVMAELDPWVRRHYPPNGIELARHLNNMGGELLGFRRYADAERLLREALAIRETKQPGDWQVFASRALLGEVLIGQRRYAEGEPLLAAAYEGLKAKRADIPADSWNYYIPRAGWQLVLLYDLTGRPEKAAAVRAELPREVAPYPRAVK